MEAFSWLGRDEPLLDRPVVVDVGGRAVGRYGGATASGARMNEDGALVWRDERHGWTLAMVLDAHAGSDSAAAVLELVQGLRSPLSRALEQPVREAFARVETHLLDAFSSPAFRQQRSKLQGETACLIAVQKGPFLWWLSIGDCVAYLIHPDLTRLGQYALNQRQFFEWIGRVDAFDRAVPTYTRGVRELRQGRNTILLLTDGLLEFGTRPFEDPAVLAETLLVGGSPDRAMRALLQRVHDEGGRDSATAILWTVENPETAPLPSHA